MSTFFWTKIGLLTQCEKIDSKSLILQKQFFSYLVWNLKPNLKASQLHFSVKYKKIVLGQEKFYRFFFELFTELLGGKLIGATVALDNEGSKENLLDLDLDTLRSMEVSVFNNFRIRFILF